MTTNLNEQCLLGFLKCANESLFGKKANLVDMLQKMGVEIVIKNPNPVYDIIDEYEYS